MVAKWRRWNHRPDKLGGRSGRLFFRNPRGWLPRDDLHFAGSPTRRNIETFPDSGVPRTNILVQPRGRNAFPFFLPFLFSSLPFLLFPFSLSGFETDPPIRVTIPDPSFYLVTGVLQGKTEPREDWKGVNDGRLVSRGGGTAKWHRPHHFYRLISARSIASGREFLETEMKCK